MRKFQLQVKILINTFKQSGLFFGKNGENIALRLNVFTDILTYSWNFRVSLGLKERYKIESFKIHEWLRYDFQQIVREKTIFKRFKNTVFLEKKF